MVAWGGGSVAWNGQKLQESVGRRRGRRALPDQARA
jgi:hypothetical protein